MKTLLISAIALLTAATATVQAKDKHKSKHHDRDRDSYSYRQNSDYRSGYRTAYRSGYRSDRSRSVYVIENRRPVQRVVYIADDGRYYRHYNGRRSYVSHYYTSYPSHYYYPSGRPRIGVSLTF